MRFQKLKTIEANIIFQTECCFGRSNISIYWTKIFLIRIFEKPKSFIQFFLTIKKLKLGVLHSKIQVELGTKKHTKNNNLWLYLASWNLLDFQLCLEPKTEPSAAKAYEYTAQKNVYWKGGPCTYLLDEGNNWGGE